MKKFTVLTGMAALGLLGLIAGNVQAAPATNVLISTFAIVGLFSPTNDTVMTTNASDTVITAKTTAKAVKITTTDILNLLATEFNTNFPAGAKLALNIGGGSHFMVLDKDGNLFLNVSNNAADSSYVFGTTNVIARSQVITGKEVLTHTATDTNMTLVLTMISSDTVFRYADGNGNDFHFSGVLTLKESLSEDPSLNKFKPWMSGRLSGSGGGVFFNPADNNYDEGVFTRAIWKAAGKTVILP